MLKPYNTYCAKESCSNWAAESVVITDLVLEVEFKVYVCEKHYTEIIDLYEAYDERIRD